VKDVNVAPAPNAPLVRTMPLLSVLTAVWSTLSVTKPVPESAVPEPVLPSVTPLMVSLWPSTTPPSTIVPLLLPVAASSGVPLTVRPWLWPISFSLFSSVSPPV
jgi:hypothetical protein